MSVVSCAARWFHVLSLNLTSGFDRKEQTYTVKISKPQK